MDIAFNANLEKIKQAILFICQELNGKVNEYNCLKIFFEADKYSLNKYAAPVTGADYIKESYGTVPEVIRQLIIAHEGRDWIKNGHFIKTQEKPDLNFLSRTDIEAIKKGIEKYGYLSFDEVKKLNHQEPAFQKTKDWQRIKFEDMIDDDNPDKDWIINDLKQMSRFMCV